jgi:hypothetical protein
MATKPAKSSAKFGPAVTVGSVTLKSYMDFVVLVENQLGWLPDTDKHPLFKARAIEVAKLKRKIAERPRIYTWPNLVRTVRYCQIKKITVSSPAAVCWKVEAMLKEAGTQQTLSDVAEKVQLAIAWEQQRDLPGKDDWISQLTRTSGDYRKAVLDEWRKARFG